MSADILRTKFLDFFRSKKHKIVESDSLVPKDDPTVLFTPAGMNQFKRQFLGFTGGFKRAASAQRCLRTDDLDKVGKTPGHHTYFEMLGNFSFGDYFKEEAIAFAWEFLTKELGIPKDKLWVSVYKDDDEAHKIWEDKIKIIPNRILKLGDKENFWPSEAKEKGPNGPCGPCSEIFFDRGSQTGCSQPDCSPACGCGRFMEVWNLVFTQYNRGQTGELTALPNKNIDTGMGLERLAAVMQGVENNFETDLFQPIIKEILHAARRRPQANNKELIYAIADHIRAIVFSIYDGILPSNEGRGYVVRKIIRKSVLHLKGLNINEAFLYKLAPLFSGIMKKPYPDLDKRRENIAEIILAEEKNFIAALNSSDKLLAEKFLELQKKADPVKAGQIAFELYDTYGLPLELTRVWLEKQNIEFSEDAFKQELAMQKIRSKSQSNMKGDVFDLKDLHLDLKATKFIGYDKYEVKAEIIKIIIDNKEVKKAKEGDEIKVILDKTAFYAESGGQVGDAGLIIKGKSILEIVDTKKTDKVTLHIGKVRKGAFKVSDMIMAKVNIERRLAIARNHTATHLLQSALRKILGAHVRQQGSLVSEDKLRFDFTHFKSLSQEELDRIEEIVNTQALNNYRLNKKTLPLSEAKRSGALAFFGEKYEDKARVISIGDTSSELCGGTHLDFTGQIGLFKIIQETSISSGVRRIEAFTGKKAYEFSKKQSGIVKDTASLLNVPEEKILLELQKRITRIKELEKETQAKRLDTLKFSIDALIQDAQKINQINLISKIIDKADMDLLRKTADLIKQKADNLLIALGAVSSGRALLVMGASEDLCAKGIDVSKLIPEIAGIIGGSGGGRRDFAQAGGNKPENFESAFERLKSIAGDLLQNNITA